MFKKVINILYFNKKHLHSYYRNHGNVFILGFQSKFVRNNFCTLPETIQDGDNEEIIKLKKWIEMCRFEGYFIPKVIKTEDYETMIAKTFHQRRKYLSFLYKKENSALKDKVKHEEMKVKRKIISEERKVLNTQSHIEYGLWHNTLFAKTTERTIVNFCEHRLASAMIHGQPMVLDLGFESHMAGRELSSLVEQIILSICLNRIDPNPFNMVFCNAESDSYVMKELKKRMPNIFYDSYPMDITSKNYLDIFPKENLIYLSPNARNVMTEIDENAVYILGGIVDLGRKEPLTMAKAKREKIMMQKLPLDRFHIFKNNKSLGIHVVLKMMLDLQRTGDWRKAMQNIPRRLISTADNDKPSSWDLKMRFRH